MVAIKETKLVHGPVERVWEVVSDVDRDPEYWNGLNSIRNLRKDENVIEREVNVGFIGSKSLQKIELKPKEAVVLTMKQGPLKGSRVVRLTPTEAKSRTRVDVSWDFEFSGVPTFAQPFIRSQLERGTKQALSKIAAEVEQSSRRPTKQVDSGRKQPR